MCIRDRVLDCYFKACSISVNSKDLAHIVLDHAIGLQQKGQCPVFISRPLFRQVDLLIQIDLLVSGQLPGQVQQLSLIHISLV